MRGSGRGTIASALSCAVGDLKRVVDVEHGQMISILVSEEILHLICTLPSSSRDGRRAAAQRVVHVSERISLLQ